MQALSRNSASVYSMQGSKLKTFSVRTDTDFHFYCIRNSTVHECLWKRYLWTSAADLPRRSTADWNEEMPKAIKAVQPQKGRRVAQPI